MRGQQATQQCGGDLRSRAHGREEGNQRVSLLLSVADPAASEGEWEGVPWTVAGDEGSVGADVGGGLGKGVIGLGGEHVVIVGRFGDVVEVDGGDELVVLGVAADEKNGMEQHGEVLVHGIRWLCQHGGHRCGRCLSLCVFGDGLYLNDGGRRHFNEGNALANILSHNNVNADGLVG